MKKLLLILLLSLCFGVAIAQSRLTIGGYGEATYTRMFYSNNYKRYTNADLYRNAPSVGQFDLPHIGIFLGAVWASISWGRYWAWDPKEVWALITMIIYAMPIHSASLSQFGKPMFLHIYLVAAIISVAITYFGVNMFLGGMHSYA